MSRTRWRVRYRWIRGEKHFYLYRLRDQNKPDCERNRLYPSLHMMIAVEQICGGLDHKSLLPMLRARDILNQTLEDVTNEETDYFQRQDRL